MSDQPTTLAKGTRVLSANGNPGSVLGPNGDSTEFVKVRLDIGREIVCLASDCEILPTASQVVALIMCERIGSMKRNLEVYANGVDINTLTQTDLAILCTDLTLLVVHAENLKSRASELHSTRAH